MWQVCPQFAQSLQPSAQQPFPLRRARRCTAMARTTTAAMAISRMISIGLTASTSPAYRNCAIRFTTTAATQAMAHCQITSRTAHFVPSSRRIEATAATQGV